MAEFVDVVKKINKVCANNDCETCPYKSYMDCLSNSYDTNTLKEIEEIAMNYDDTDWSKVPVDTKILVRNSTNDDWEKRYFAKYEGKLFDAFDGGCTSWTSQHTSFWRYAKLYEEGAEELSAGEIELKDELEDTVTIHSTGMEEGIRCAMCTNPMANDRGCDGGCRLDEDMYNKVLDVIYSNIIK